MRLRINNKRHITLVDMDKRIMRITADQIGHDLLKVTLLHDGGTFGLDLTGAQYGYYDPVVEWETYATTQVDGFVQRYGIENFAYFGGLRDLLEGDYMNPRARVFALNAKISGSLVGMVRRWEDTNMAVWGMLDLPEVEFLETKERFLEIMRSGLKRRVASERTLMRQGGR